MRGIGWRLFLTCWLVYVVHFATDFVREHYLVVSIVEDHSFRLDKYYGLHVDIFQNPPDAPHGGAHHGANPGISMVAAVPYFLLKPAVDAIVSRNLAARAARGDSAIVYNDPRWRRVEFYQRIRKRGLDVRFGLVSLITQAFCQAPLSALSVVVLFWLLVRLGLRQGTSILLALLYAFGTPVFLRTAYLNQNLSIGLFGLFAFVLLWDPGDRSRLPVRTRYLLAGLLGGLAVLCDYSGALLLGLLGLYAWWRRTDRVSWGRGLGDALWYGLGAVPGVLMLWWYQWAAFGNPFLPPQNWMPPVQWSDVGYQGVGGFSPGLFKLLLFDPRYGLFITMPVALLALAAPWVVRRGRSFLPRREAWFCLATTLAMVLFFSIVQYTRLQWVTGIRYLAAIFPFVFLAAAAVLIRLPRVLAAGMIVLSVIINWSIAMVRNQGTVFDNVERVFLQGFQLPALTVLDKTATQYVPWLKGPVSALPALVLMGVLLALIWTIDYPWRSWTAARSGPEGGSDGTILATSREVDRT